MLPDRIPVRLARCVLGLALFGVGISLQIDARLGNPPWDVFHQGVSLQTGVSIGRVIVLTGLALLLLWIPLRQRPGIGTILNAFVIGTVADVALRIIPEPASLPIRGAMVAAGILCVAIGSALYIGSGLGPGPRDGLMTGLAARGMPVRVARTGIEVTVLVVGWLLGGRVGVGTVVFALTIGPLVQWWLPRLAFSSGSARA